jgi:hypothetical protein
MEAISVTSQSQAILLKGTAKTPTLAEECDLDSSMARPLSTRWAFFPIAEAMDTLVRADLKIAVENREILMTS